MYAQHSSSSGDLLRSIRQYDLFPKFTDSYEGRAQTPLGGLISLFTVLLMAFLFFSEFFAYIRPDPTAQILVDNTNSDTKMLVNFDLTFHRVSNLIFSFS